MLTHICEAGGGIVSLTVWTASDEGPRLVGEVESPPDVYVEDWSDDQGVLCVSFLVADSPENFTSETRAFSVGPNSVSLLDGQSCEVEDP